MRQAGFLNGKPSVNMMIFRQPGANIIATVDRVKAAIPSLQATIPRGEHLVTLLDRTLTIRASVSDIERTLLISVMLVMLVVFVFLRNVRATFIPAVAVPVSLIGTCAVMYLCGYSLDNLSLMALAIASGFVVDDAIVVMENITPASGSRHVRRSGRAQGRAGDRLHGFQHQRFADRRFHSAAADGRHHRAPVPRVRHYAFGRHCGFHAGFPHHYAHDVFARAARRKPGPARPDL